MKFRSLILVLVVTFSFIFMSMIGTSYAYYVITGGPEIKVVTSDLDVGMAVLFDQSSYINMQTGVPIKQEDADIFADKSVFKLTPDSQILGDSEVKVSIGIVDLNIDSELRVSDFKYKLSCSDGSIDRVLSSGDGTNITDEVLESKYLNLGLLSTTDNTFSASKTYTCTFSVWLEDTGGNQNALMEKKFSGLIKVNTLFKK